MTRYWIGVASRNHVRAGLAGGFCQLGHGREAPVRRRLPLLSFTREREAAWGYVFRRGVFAIEAADYAVIAKAMEAGDEIC